MMLFIWNICRYIIVILYLKALVFIYIIILITFATYTTGVIIVDHAYTIIPGINIMYVVRTSGVMLNNTSAIIRSIRSLSSIGFTNAIGSISDLKSTKVIKGIASIAKGIARGIARGIDSVGQLAAAQLSLANHF